MMQHVLRYVPRSPGGQNWSGAAAGYTASCTCGAWTWNGIVDDPQRPPAELTKAHFLHEGTAED